MGRMSTMSPHHGDVQCLWDADVEDEVKEAEKEFYRVIAEGYAAYKADEHGQNSEAIREFDKDAPEILLAFPLVGG